MSTNLSKVGKSSDYFILKMTLYQPGKHTLVVQFI